jgi:hypothetical protein
MAAHVLCCHDSSGGWSKAGKPQPSRGQGTAFAFLGLRKQSGQASALERATLFRCLVGDCGTMNIMICN